MIKIMKKIRARVPAKGPIPTEAAKIIAQNRSGMVRTTFATLAVALVGQTERGAAHVIEDVVGELVYRTGAPRSQRPPTLPPERR